MTNNIEEGLEIVLPVIVGIILIVCVVTIVVMLPWLALAIVSWLALITGVSWMVGAWRNARK